MTPFGTILVPLDGSELAEKAIGPASRIAAAMAREAGETEARVILLRVVSPITLMAADPMLYDEMTRMGTEEAQAYLNSVAGSLSIGAAQLQLQTTLGSPADAIVHFAEENGVDLIVMSSHGRTGSSRWVYGSVAEKVMHHAPCATAIIRAHVAVDMFANRKMLVPLDGSPLAERALGPALTIARAVQSDVTLLRVTMSQEPFAETMSPAGSQLGAALTTEAERERADAESYLQHLYRDQAANEHLFFDVITTSGDVADAIVTYADTHHVDLIVMSSHGRSGIGRWLHGSVAEKVLRGADCATLIIRNALS